MRHSATMHFRLRLHTSGTVSSQPLRYQHHCHPSSGTLKVNFSCDPIQTYNLRQLIVVLRIIITYRDDLEVRMNYTSR